MDPLAGQLRPGAAGAERRRHPGLTGEGENQTKIGFLVTNVHNLFNKYVGFGGRKC